MASTDRTERLTVLWLVRGLGPGGMERLLLTHARVGDHTRFRYLLAYLTERPVTLADEFRDAGVEVISAVSSPPMAAAKIRRIVTSREVDIVHAHAPLPASIVRVVARTTRPRPAVLTTEHNSWGCYRPATRLVNALTTPLDDARLAVSRAAALGGPAWLMRPPSDVLIHGLVPRDSVVDPAPIRSEIGLDPLVPLGVVVANHRPEKAYDTLFDALSRLGEDAPKFHLVAAGGGPLLENHRRLVAARRLEGTITVLGHRNDVPELLAAADGFMLSSRFEGLPVALMEAAAAGLPVVATRVGGIDDVLRGPAAEFLVDPDSPTQLADALVRWASDPSGRDRVAQATAAIASMFDGRRAVRAQEALYERLRR